MRETYQEIFRPPPNNRMSDDQLLFDYALAIIAITQPWLDEFTINGTCSMFGARHRRKTSPNLPKTGQKVGVFEVESLITNQIHMLPYTASSY